MNSPDLIGDFLSDEGSVDVILESIGGAVKPWHRLAIKLHVEGRSNNEISNFITGEFTSREISSVITSAWGKAQITAALLEDSDRSTAILMSTELDNIYTLIELRDGDYTPSVRFNAAKTLMQQAGGRPAQKISLEGSMHSADDVTASKGAIDEQIRKLLIKAE